MNSKERVLCALSLEEPDRVPVGENLINDVIINELLNQNPNPKRAVERMVACYRNLGLDLVPAPLDGIVSGISGDFPKSKGEVVDAVGRKYVWNEYSQTWWYIGGVVRTEDDLVRYTPDPSQDELYETTRKTVEIAGDDLAIVGAIDNSELTSQSLGIERFCISFYKDQRLLRRSLEVRTDFIIEAAKRMIELGVDAIVSFDDMADKNGPMISPTQYREFILPQHKRFVSEIGKKVPVLIHTDGNIWSVIDLFLEAGFNGINPLEPGAGMDIKKVKEKYGERLCLMGNVDAAHTLCDRPITEVVKETKYCLESAAPGGGYILASSSSLHNTISLERYRVMLATATSCGKYPLVRSENHWRQ